ncbi:nucleoside monophosphate kinase [Candidatus Peregrinibacteria bacterium]|nr:nucleoside monophosphate kinase [Candidatus Peregrinibacteria bacterium]
MDIVLFGIQGSGKGTLSKIIAEKYGFVIFETGSELRKLSSEDTELARKVKSIVESGKLVPNEIVMDIIENFMHHLPNGKAVLFDGIPRKMEQAETFDALMERNGRKFTGILINVPESTALRRLTTRRLCENCKTVYPADYTKDNCEKCGGKLVTRSDDNPESIKTRIAAFNEETMPVIEKYKKENLMVTMNGDQPIDTAAKEILEVVAKILS